MPATITSGTYQLVVKVPQYVKKKVTNSIIITAGTTVSVPAIYLFAGDANDDDTLSILDYNIIRDCYSDNLPPLSCTDPVKKAQADINDDGVVNQIDYNLFLRELVNIHTN